MSSDPDLVLRMLRELREKIDANQEEFRTFRKELKTELAHIKNVLGGAAKLVLSHEHRITRLESRPSK